MAWRPLPDIDPDDELPIYCDEDCPEDCMADHQGEL